MIMIIIINIKKKKTGSSFPAERKPNDRYDDHLRTRRIERNMQPAVQHSLGQLVSIGERNDRLPM